MILGPFPFCHSFSSTHFPVFIFMYSFPFSSSQIPIVLYAPSEITIESAFCRLNHKIPDYVIIFRQDLLLGGVPQARKIMIPKRSADHPENS